MDCAPSTNYRGRLAPTPTGHLHAGHAATFIEAHRRARSARGTLVMRIEDLDPRRCLEEFADAAMEDLRWLGLDWDEGPDLAGPAGPYRQSERRDHYLAAWRRLRDAGFLYPCSRSRREVAQSPLAPHEGEEEPIFPREWRTPAGEAARWDGPVGTNWRFRVPDGETLSFQDRRSGPIRRIAGVDFGDFLVWNRDDVPAYELAVVVDDIAMGITEVVRGEDLLTSTCRQLLIYRALGANPPAFFHCPLLRDGGGRRLSKRAGDLSLRALREAGRTPGEIRGLAGVQLS